METTFQGGRAAACQNLRTEVFKLLDLVDQAKEQGLGVEIQQNLVIDIGGKSVLPVDFGIALDGLIKTVERASASQRAPEAFGDRNVFKRAGGGWLIQYDGKVIAEPDGKGPQFTAELIRRRNEVWVPCGQIRRPHEASSYEPMSEARQRTEGGFEAQLLQEGLMVTSGNTKEVSSITNCRDLRKAIAVHDKALKLAVAKGDANQCAELEALISRLKANLRVEQREKVTGPAEVDRKAVLKALIAWFEHLRGVHPTLAKHLDDSITKGYECAYRPNVPTDWLLCAGTMLPMKAHAPSGGAE